VEFYVRGITKQFGWSRTVVRDLQQQRQQQQQQRNSDDERNETKRNETKRSETKRNKANLNENFPTKNQHSLLGGRMYLTIAGAPAAERKIPTSQ
jgi:hypothetical protein